MKITNTNKVDAGAPQIFCYAFAGAGKTTAIGTLPHADTLIIAAEDGLLPLAGKAIETVTVESAGDLRPVYEHAKAAGKKWIAVDTLTEIAELVLADQLEQKPDPRQAYGEMAKQVLGFVRALKRLDCGLYVTSHMSKVRDEATGNVLRGPGFPGQQVATKIPHLFDVVTTIRVREDDKGNTLRAFQTQPDGVYECKDRSGMLDQMEPCDLSAIAAKIANKSAKAATKEKK